MAPRNLKHKDITQALKEIDRGFLKSMRFSKKHDRKLHAEKISKKKRIYLCV